jgi:hypothetical protein
MEVIGDKKSKRIPLDISPLFFHIVSELVQALVITYSEIFQALAVEGDVLLLKPFLGPHPTRHTALTQPSWNSMCLENWKTISEAGNFHLMTLAKLRSRSHVWSRTSPTTTAWKISSCVMTSA